MILQLTTKIVRGMNRLATFAGDQCAFIATGTTLQLLTRNAEQNERQSGKLNPVGIAEES